MPRAFRFGAGRDWSSWPVLLLLLTMLVPSAGVVWMMRAAMESERLAVRQRLVDAYRVQLESAKRGVSAHWKAELARLEEVAGEGPASEAFAKCVTTGQVDSVLIRGAEGTIAYPAPAVSGAAGEPRDGALVMAERMEFSEGNSAGAAAAYARIAESAADESLQAQARQAQARCLLRIGERAAAIEALRDLRSYERAADTHGRLMAADAELRLLELLLPNTAEWAAVHESLRGRVNDYSDSNLPAAQRRFLMHRLPELAPQEPGFKTLAAEDLAALALDLDETFASNGGLQAIAGGDVWKLGSPQGRVVGLYRTSTVSAQLKELLAQQLMPRGLNVEAHRPGESGDRDGELPSVSLGPTLPGWRLAMETSGSDLFEQATSERRALLAWVAATLVGVTLVMTWAVAAGVRRQMQVARLKNDLVATVSHELKTPLASIRLLVDSLLDEGGASVGGAEAAGGKTREYLQMIAHENTRLTRLIDNFLTFSRMERRKHQFNLEPVDVSEILEQAAAAVADRYNASDAQLTVEVESGPDSELWVHGDIDALVTAVVNLLDNAWKYSGDAKQVRVTARREGCRALITVEDNGVGLTPRAARRVFERFYQVDQRLSRTQGGCGLGLSIVRYIVEAHGGEATVESRAGEGCRFTLALPLDDEAASREGSDWSLKRPVRSGEESA